MGVLLNEEDMFYVGMDVTKGGGDYADIIEVIRAAAKAQLKKDMEYFEELLGEDDIHTALGYKVMNIRRELEGD